MPPPPCDRHKNLQMVSLGQTGVYGCPVPSCGHCHDNQGYFELLDSQLVREERAGSRSLFSAKLLKAIRTVKADSTGLKNRGLP
jgi:hypothetical protein